MELMIFKEVEVRLPARRLDRLFDMVVAGEGRPGWPGVVNLVLTRDAKIRDLNRQYRSLDKATDVLSFNIDPADQPDGTFGEIYISVPYARRQAEKVGRGIWDELLLLTCHGLLHLFGHDHGDKKQEREMFGRQNKYLERLREAG